jgi:uncharacterized protein YcfL
MRITTVIVFTLILLMQAGCSQPTDPRVNLGDKVGSSTLGGNFITRPIADAVNLLLGKGIVIKEIKTKRNASGFMIVQVRGVNESVRKRLFEHRAEWLDEDGFAVDTVTTNWMPISVSPKSEFTFKVVATRREAVDYRINTRVDNNTK